MIGAVPVVEDPLREVRSFQVLPHPSGKFILMVTYTCGHAIWWWRKREPRQPPRARRCTTCWLEALHPPEPVSVAGLLRRGRAVAIALRALEACDPELLAALDRALAAIAA